MSSDPKPKKSLGQHWLNDNQTLQDICELAQLESTDTVLEIGPGLGSLTKILTASSKTVIAVELDYILANQLIANVGASNLEVVNESILKYDLTKLPPDYKLVANIPYYLTSNLLRLLSETKNPPSLIVLLVQKEVAQRVAAKPGDMSLLSVTTQFYWHVSLERIVKAEMFTPSPKVDSQVILLNRRDKSLFNDIDESKFFRLVKIGFSARRKTLENSLTNGLRIDKGIVTNSLNELNINPSIRPQMLDIEQWHTIYKKFTSDKII